MPDPTSSALRQIRLGAARLLPLVALACGVWLLVGHVRTLDLDQIVVAFGAVPAVDWGLAIIATAISFAAVGHYDVGVHRMLNSTIPPRAARRAGMQAIALSQTVGFGTLTGTLVRWRSLPDLSLWAATRLSVLVGLSFLAAWAIVTAAVLWIAPPEGPVPGLLVWGGTAAAAALVAGLLLWRRVRPTDGMIVTLPGALHLIGWTMIDTGAAALALWLLLPETPDLSFPALFAAYLLALGAGLLSNAPGGIGAFELTLLTLLPAIGDESLLAGLLGFRLIYYALPALIALVSLLWPDRAVTLPEVHPGHAPCPAWAPAGWGLARQGAVIATVPGRAQGWLVRALPGVLVSLGPPAGQPPAGPFRDLARSQDRWPLFHNCDPRTAARLRQDGWRVLRTAQEAIITLSDHDPTQPACRHLRRKLAVASRAGVTIRGGFADPDDLVAVHRDWLTHSGHERGFSMGRFDLALICGQQVFTAHQDGALIAFVTFFATPQKWTLDLMRHRHACPSGTMHMLVSHALSQARDVGVGHLSLAGVPHVPWRPGHRIGRGLRQFKQGFAPVWHPRYAAAPHLPALVRGLGLVTLAVHRPDWFGLAPVGQTTGRQPPADPVSAWGQAQGTPASEPWAAAQFGFESGLQSCDATPQQASRALVRVAASRTDKGPDPAHDQTKRAFPPP